MYYFNKFLYKEICNILNNNELSTHSQPTQKKKLRNRRVVCLTVLQRCWNYIDYVQPTYVQAHCLKSTDKV